jgi:hypothetical protein
MYNFLDLSVERNNSLRRVMNSWGMKIAAGVCPVIIENQGLKNAGKAVYLG